MDLKILYQKFMREYVDKKWLKTLDNVVVLGEKLLAGYYVVIFETEENGGEFICPNLY